MRDRPDLDAAVFARVLRDCRVRSLPDPGEEEREEEEGMRDDGDADADLEVRRGDVWVLRWRSVRRAVGRGDVELI
jgi:GINS complex subunit 4